MSKGWRFLLINVFVIKWHFVDQHHAGRRKRLSAISARSDSAVDCLLADTANLSWKKAKGEPISIGQCQDLPPREGERPQFVRFIGRRIGDTKYIMGTVQIDPTFAREQRQHSSVVLVMFICASAENMFVFATGILSPSTS